MAEEHDVEDAREGDIYRDPSGRLWMVMMVERLPVVEMVEIDASRRPGENWTKFGPAPGTMWDGFRRASRVEPVK